MIRFVTNQLFKFRRIVGMSSESHFDGIMQSSSATLDNDLPLNYPRLPFGNLSDNMVITKKLVLLGKKNWCLLNIIINVIEFIVYNIVAE